MPLLFLPTVLQSNAVYGNNKNINGCTITAYFTGTIQFYVGLSTSPTTPPVNWEEVTLQSGVEKTHSFTNTGKWLYYKILKDNSAVVYVPKDSFGRPTAPAVRIYDVTEDS